MVASLQGSMGSGTKEVKNWVHVGCWILQCCGLFLLGAHFETYGPCITLIFKIFFWAALNRE
jgi:hypothetical protein